MAVSSFIALLDVINQEYREQGDNVLDFFNAARIDGAGVTVRRLDFDSEHQYVSVVTMLAPSVDQMMGVSSLRLCDGSTWKSKVKMCGELFSTATMSDRVSDGRNSIQEMNCSFGFFEFEFLHYKTPLFEELSPEESPDYQSQRPLPIFNPTFPKEPSYVQRREFSPGKFFFN